MLSRPNVVVGQQQQISITYNEAGPPAQVKETGYEPLKKQAIERTSRCTYEPINGRSLLT